MARRIKAFTAVLAATIVGSALIATPASAAVIARKCTPIFAIDPGETVRACVQEDSAGGFNSVVDIVLLDGPLFVFSDLEQCRGDGTACELVSGNDGPVDNGHHFIASPIVHGAHGHSYRSHSAIPGRALITQFIAFP
jgi:hypothetical protein